MDAGCGRRRCLAAGVVLAAQALGSALPLSAVGGCAGAVPNRRPSARAVEVAAGVYMVRGAPGEPTVANQGRVGNAGFVVGDEAVLAIDTGTSFAQGMSLLAAVASVTPRPVAQVVLTHARQEFIFGAAAYRDRGIPIMMQRRAAQLMALRCGLCLRNLQRLLGEPAMRGTALVVPDALVDAAAVVDLGGRRVQLNDHGHSAGPGDLSATDLQSGVVYAGGLVDVARIPDIRDADMDGWQQALAALEARPLRTVVPGHGAAAPAAAAIAATSDYLRALTARVQALLQAGAALSEVPAAAALPEYAGWDGYPGLHVRNAASLYVRLERAQLFDRVDRPGPAGS